jgi:hypothetical protein
MLVRKRLTFTDGREFVAVTILEADGEFFLAVRSASDLGSLHRGQLESARHIVDLFLSLESAQHSFDRRCRDLSRRGWRSVKAA